MRKSKLEKICGTENPNRRGDVVFIHGLNGNAYTTWQPRGQPEQFWPSWLGEDLSDVGIWSVGYPANAFFEWGSTMRWVDRAVNILHLLDVYDVGTNRPVVFITHSMGGTLMKEMLRKVDDGSVRESEALTEHTKGVVFLSTPHSGSTLAKFMYSLKVLLPSDNVRELRPNEPRLRELDSWYRNNVAKLRIKTRVYCERRKMFGAIEVVDPTSSDPCLEGVTPYPQDEDHRTISKLERTSPLYEGIKKFVDDCLKPSGNVGDSKASVPSLSSEVQREAVGQFLQSIESRFNTISLFHTNEPIILSEQYIPIQVTLERRYKHTVETAWSYAESEAELKRIYALKGGEEEIKRQQVSWKDAKREHSRIVVLADPGMGKSTLLRMEVGTTIQDSRQVLDDGKPLKEIVIPLFIRLSTLADKIMEISIEEAILDIIRNEYSKPLKHHENAEVSKFLNTFLKEQLLNSKCLLLLDALDEVSPEKRHKLLGKLNGFAQDYPTCPIVGTSRIVGYGGKLVDGAKDMEIVPFIRKQINQYIETWFINTQKHLKDQSISAEELIQALRDRPQISGLAQNPLLLSLICSLYQQDKLTLPARRCQIYEKAVEYMLGEWRQTRQTAATCGKEAKIRLLEALAYHFTYEGQEVFKYEDLFDWIEEYLENGKAPRDFRDFKTEELIAELSENDGILRKLYLDREDKQYLFLHRTFQEYLTASYLSRMIKKDSSEGIALVKKYLWKYDWHETLSLLAGVLREPMPLIETIAAEKDDIFHTQLLLAGRCIAECKQTNALIPLSSKIIEKILTFWRKYPDAEFIRSVVVAIGQNNSHICQRLQESLCDSDEDVRYRAIGALGKIGNDQALVALITALKNDLHEYVRRGAAQALGQIGNEQALDPLITALKNDPHAYVRRGAAQALGQIGNEQALDPLINALNNDPHEYVRRGAIQALGQTGNPQAVEDLTNALNNDPNEYVRRGITQALGQIGNPQALEALINALNNDPHEYVRRGAAQALGQIGNPQALEALITALNKSESDKGVRCMAAAILGRNGNSQAVDVLITALNDSDKNDSWLIVDALRRSSNLQMLRILIGLLSHYYEDVRNATTCYYSGQVGSAQAVDALIAALSDSDRRIRRMAADALGRNGNPQAVDALIAALNDSDKDDRWLGIDTLGRNGNPQSVDALIATLNDFDKDDRWLAIDALGQIDNSEILEKIVQSLEIDIYDNDIFCLTRTLAVRFSSDRTVGCIPVYPELVRKAEEGDRDQEVE
jgi:HEAT repeat protein/pimeloyl-ACP methyl ester carboxylesterase